jgi:DNA-binding XRE family transcriptional regulator
LRALFPKTQTWLKPKDKRYPKTLETIGNHLLKRRLDLKLLQKDVAKIIGVSEDSIRFWETGYAEPQIQHAPGIIQFLGYCPYPFETETLGGRIKYYRLLNGLSCKKLGKVLKVDASTISSWEDREFQPEHFNLKRLNQILNK